MPNKMVNGQLVEMSAAEAAAIQAEWDNHDPRAFFVEQVKVEANRRILEIVPEWKQRNLLAQAAILNRKPMAEWTAEEQAQVDAGDAIWAQVAGIRAKSNEIETMDPMPSDIMDDALWE